MEYSPNLTGKKKEEMVKWLKEQIKDETISAKIYGKRGFDLIARDERQHARWLENALGRLM